MKGREAPRRAVLVGFMGAGKSSVGKELARRLGAEFVDVDDRIEADAGKTIGEIFSGEGERAFRERERKAIRDAVSVPGRVIATGGGSFLDNENRLRLKEYAPVIFLDVSPGTALRRLSGNTTRPLLSGENREETVADLMASRRAAYMEADFRVNTEDRSPDRVAETVYTLLSRKTKTGEGGWNPGTERRRE